MILMYYSQKAENYIYIDNYSKVYSNKTYSKEGNLYQIMYQ